MSALLLVPSFLLLAVPRLLRQSDLDYVLVILVCALSLASYAVRKRSPLSMFDLGWLTAAVFAALYVLVSLMQSAKTTIVATQALIFFMPLISLRARLTPGGFSAESLQKAAMWICFVKVLSILPYFDGYLAALTSAEQRVRANDFSSVVVVFFLAALLVHGLVRGRRRRLFAAVSLVFLAAAIAHRSLFLALAVQFLAAMSLKSSKTFKRVVAASAAGVFVLLFLPVGEIMIKLVNDSLAGVDGNTNWRLEWAKQVLISSLDLPLGRTFGHAFEFGTSGKEDAVYYALQHNSFLTYLYFLGWLPFLVTMSAFGYLLFAMKAYSPQAKVYKNMIIGMMVFAYFNVFLEQPIYGFFFWMVVGLFLAQYRIDLAQLRDMHPAGSQVGYRYAAPVPGRGLGKAA